MFISNFGTAILSLGFFLSGNWKRRVIKGEPLLIEPVPVDARSSETVVEETHPLQR
jgi:hypothetical protein